MEGVTSCWGKQGVMDRMWGGQEGMDSGAFRLGSEWAVVVHSDWRTIKGEQAKKRERERVTAGNKKKLSSDA